MINDFKNKRIGIVGLGIEGLSTAKFLAAKGALLTILDRNPKNDLDQEKITEAESLGANFITGEGYLNDLDTFDFIVRSPGIHRAKIDKGNSKRKNILSQTKLFFEYCPCQIIGITGTKGKGTTATLIYEMLKEQGRDVYLGGNIGVPPLDFLDKLSDSSIVVLELSSFQLLDLKTSPHIAVLLMITSEHLDYHSDTYEYVEAKRNLLRFQTATDFAVVNIDYPASRESDIHTNGRIYEVSREIEPNGDGCYVKEKAIWLKLSGKLEKIIDVDNIFLPGGHNLENVCAAVMASTLAGASKNAIVTILKSFKGLPHRLELIAKVNGVRFYDDSFSTTPETAIAAIKAFKEPKILILGGSSKGSNFTELGEVIASDKSIKAIIGIGEEWEKIKSKLNVKESPIIMIEGATTMLQIVAAAKKIAESGDIVLLSPACASFGMFKNYKDRGDQFKNEINKLNNNAE